MDTCEHVHVRTCTRATPRASTWSQLCDVYSSSPRPGERRQSCVSPPAGVIATDALVPRRGASVPALRATRDDGDDVPFGYTRLDVILIGGGVTGLGFAAYYGLQEFAGFDAQWAGNVVQLTFVLLLTLLWVGSYVQRVFNKDMTYGKQLKEYEEAVMQKRLEEMPESELMALMDESEKKER